MSLHIAIAPDFAPSRYAGWYFFATMLQKQAEMQLKLHLPTTAEEQSELIESGQADFIYANPYDSAELIREKGYRAVARPVDVYDEMVIVTQHNSEIKKIEDIPRNAQVSLAANKDIEMIGLRLLEPANVDASTLRFQYAPTFPAVVRALCSDQAAVGFLLADAFESMSAATQAKLRVLRRSDIQDIHHAMLAHSRVDKAAGLKFLKGLLSAGKTKRGRAWLTELGIPDGFAIMLKEDGEFMIDLMETLKD